MTPRPRSLAAVAAALLIGAGPAGAGAGHLVPAPAAPAETVAPGPPAAWALSPAGAERIRLLPPAMPLYPDRSLAAAESRARLPESAPAHPRSLRTRAWVVFGAGVALTAVSFVLAERADAAYDDYRAGVDPATLDADYHRAVRYDRWATASLLAGQLGLALGVYCGFLSGPPAAPRVAFAVTF